MLPQLGMLLFSLAGRGFDWLRSQQFCSVTNLRKIFNSTGFFVPALTFVAVQFLPCHMKVLKNSKVYGIDLICYQISHVVLISFGMAIHQLAISGGFYFSHSEVAGPYSG